MDSNNLGNDPEREQQAIELASKHNVQLIFQEFEHEALLLRHISGHEHDRPGKGEGREALQAAWPEYRRRYGKLQLYENFGLEDLQRACSAEPVLRSFLGQIGFPV